MGSKKPYSNMQEIVMPRGARAAFVVRFETARRRARLLKSIISGTYVALSVVACVLSSISVASALSQSGAYDFIALAFGDMAVLSYSKELALSIIESLPVLGVASLILTLFFLSRSVPRFVRGRSMTPLYI